MKVSQKQNLKSRPTAEAQRTEFSARFLSPLPILRVPGHVNMDILAERNLSLSGILGLSSELEGGDHSWSWGLEGGGPGVLSPLSPTLRSQGWADSGNPAVS